MPDDINDVTSTEAELLGKVRRLEQEGRLIQEGSIKKSKSRLRAFLVNSTPTSNQTERFAIISSAFLDTAVVYSTVVSQKNYQKFPHRQG